MANPVELVGGIAIGTGVGAAVGATVTPKLQDFLNEQWSKYPNKPPPAALLAAGVAQGQVDEAEARQWAKETGFGSAQMDALIAIADTGPGIARAFELWRRGKIGEGGFRRACKRAALEDEWTNALVEIKEDVLNPAVLAVAIVRGLVPDPGILPVPPPSGVGKVPRFPVFPIDALAEAEAAGLTKDHLSVLVGNAGRPMGPESAAAAVFKDIIERVDYDRAISEGDVRNEWADAIFENSRPIPHPLDYVQARLRGWRSTAEMHAGAHRSGMSDADTDLLFLIHGRPPSVRQVFIGLRRGGVYDGPTTDIPPPVLKAMQESDIRPEWFNLLDAQKESLPSAFVLRGLTQSGDLTEDETHTLLLHSGWPAALAAKVAARWAGGTGTTVDPYVKKAQTHLWTTTHRSYVAEESDAAAAGAALTALGVPAAAQADVIALWDHERGLIRAQLTPAQVKKAYRGAVTNQATGAPFTRDDALAELLQRGYSLAEANEFLDL